MTIPIARSIRHVRRLLSSSCTSAASAPAVQSNTIARRSSNTFARRSFSSSSTNSSGGGSNSTQVAFDRDLKKTQRNNAARAHQLWRENSDADRVDYDYFREEIARRLVDRLDDIKRDEGFPLALDIGACVRYIYIYTYIYTFFLVV